MPKASANASVEVACSEASSPADALRDRARLLCILAEMPLAEHRELPFALNKLLLSCVSGTTERNLPGGMAVMARVLERHEGKVAKGTYGMRRGFFPTESSVVLSIPAR